MKNKIDIIKQVLIEDDPMGLIKMGAPLDEYDHEAESVANAITHNSTPRFIQNVLWNVFYNAFCHSLCTNDATGQLEVKFMNNTRANKMIGAVSRYKVTAIKVRNLLKSRGA
jgi:hypothetical protein